MSDQSSNEKDISGWLIWWEKWWTLSQRVWVCTPLEEIAHIKSDNVIIFTLQGQGSISICLHLTIAYSGKWKMLTNTRIPKECKNINLNITLQCSLSYNHLPNYLADGYMTNCIFSVLSPQALNKLQSNHLENSVSVLQ